MSTPSPKRKRMVIVGTLAGLGMIAAAGGGLASSLKAATAVTPPQSVEQVFAMPSLAGVVEAVSPAVVSIEVTHKARPASSAQQRRGPELPEHFRRFFGEDFFERFGRGQEFGPGPRMPRGGMGSGFIVDADGHIVTSNHVVAGAEAVTVILDDGTRLDATVIGGDARTDLALLKVESGGPLPTVRFADADATRVGDWVVAIGNPFGVGKTATFGIVSARGRGTGQNPYQDHLQIDAPINSGNSGGPTVNLHGEVIGVNTSIVSPSGGNVGIGFAVPAATAMTVIDDLRAHGQVMRGWLGVHIQPVTQDIAASLGMEDTEGAIVARVQPESPAAAAGLEARRRHRRGGPGAGEGRARAHPRDRRHRRRDRRHAHGLARRPARRAHRGDRQRWRRRWRRACSQSGADEAGRLDSFGLRLENVDPATEKGADTGSVMVAEVAPGSAAARKGVRPGDTIVTVGNEPVGSIAEVNERIDAAREDGREAVLLLMSRDGSERFVALPFATS